jgi:hypothetical protein
VKTAYILFIHTDARFYGNPVQIDSKRCLKEYLDVILV